MKLHRNITDKIPTVKGELWVDAIGYEGYYKVSSLGRIWSISRYVNHNRHGIYWRNGRLLRQKKSKYGYMCVRLSVDKHNKHIGVHRIVLMSFNNRKPVGKNDVNHIDGDKANNKYNNLEWCNAKENISHAIRTGLSDRVGSANGRALITEEKVIEMRKQYKRKAQGCIIRLSQKYKLSVRQVGKICRREAWKHIN